MGRLIVKTTIWAKIESSYGVDPTASGTDAVLAEDVQWSFEGARMNERPATRPGMAKLQYVYGGTLCQLSFAVELKGPGSAYAAATRPEMDALLRACGFGATIVTTPGSESATYKPVSSAFESCAIYFRRDGKEMKLLGCRGNVEFTLEAGARGMAKFTMTGHVSADADVAMGTPTYDSALPPPVLNAPLAIGVYSAKVQSLAFSPNNQIGLVGDISAADGFGEIQITGRDTSGTINPEDPLVATYPFIANYKAGTTAALTSGLIGATQYNRYTVSFPGVYWREVAPGDREGLATLDLTFGALESSGDDEVAIAFT